MPQSWSRQRKRLDKKSIVSSYCENKTTVYSDRALNIMRLPHPYVWDIVNAISVLKGSGKPHPYSGIRFWWLAGLGAALCFIEGKLPSAHKSFRGIGEGFGEGEGSPFSKGAPSPPPPPPPRFLMPEPMNNYSMWLCHRKRLMFYFLKFQRNNG